MPKVKCVTNFLLNTLKFNLKAEFTYFCNGPNNNDK